MFDFYTGVDQTGAIRRSRHSIQYKPLPTAILSRLSNDSVKLHVLDSKKTPITLKTFGPRAIRDAISEIRLMNSGSKSRDPRVAVLADCVLGLPFAAQLCPFDLRKMFHEAMLHEESLPGYTGRAKAANFFDRLLQNYAGQNKQDRSENFPRRICEKLTGSNSVFQKHPFQKNIQSGTYRMWRDLGKSLHEDGADQRVSIWPHDFLSNTRTGLETLVIGEGYPSLYWRHFFESKNRKPEKIKELVLKTFQSHEIEISCDSWTFLAGNPDAADAAILAVTAFLMDREKSLFPALADHDTDHLGDTSAKISIEGWIAGAQADFFRVP